MRPVSWPKTNKTQQQQQMLTSNNTCRMLLQASLDLKICELSLTTSSVMFAHSKFAHIVF